MDATTQIISLGLLRTVERLVVLLIAVEIRMLQAIAINRLAGMPYPRWAPQPPAASPPP